MPRLRLSEGVSRITGNTAPATGRLIVMTYRDGSLSWQRVGAHELHESDECQREVARAGTLDRPHSCGSCDSWAHSPASIVHRLGWPKPPKRNRSSGEGLNVGKDMTA